MNFLIFLTTFGIIFLGELGDKTQLTVFNLSLKFKESWKVGLGATLGFACVVTFGVMIGFIVEDYVPLTFLSYICGAIFIVLAVVGFAGLPKEWRGHRKSQGHTPEESHEQKQSEEIIEKHKTLQKNPILAGFGFIFLMEMGDKTQLLTISLASVNLALFEVWLGAFLALSTLAWIGAFFGGAIAKKVPKFYLAVASAALFFIIGLWLMLNPA